MRKWNCDLYPIQVDACGDYCLHIRYNNGENVIFDAKRLLNKPVFMRLTDMDFFKTVRIDFDTVAWGNDIDIAPETLYECSVSADNFLFLKD